MDKPLTLSVKQFLIRRTSVDMAIPEKVIEEVINHQFASMLDAMTRNDSVEMSGFGKFLFNSKKVLRMIKTHEANIIVNQELLTQDLSPQKRRSTEIRLRTIIDTLEGLKKRINETQF